MFVGHFEPGAAINIFQASALPAFPPGLCEGSPSAEEARAPPMAEMGLNSGPAATSALALYHGAALTAILKGSG